MQVAMTYKYWPSTPPGSRRRRAPEGRRSHAPPYPPGRIADELRGYVPTIELLPRRCPGGGLRRVYAPIDRMLGEVINPFLQPKALSADPYDDELMEAFCSYIEASGRRMDKVKKLFQSLPPPPGPWFWPEPVSLPFRSRGRSGRTRALHHGLRGWLSARWSRDAARSQTATQAAAR